MFYFAHQMISTAETAVNGLVCMMTLLFSDAGKRWLVRKELFCRGQHAWPWPDPHYILILDDVRRVQYLIQQRISSLKTVMKTDNQKRMHQQLIKTDGAARSAIEAALNEVKTDKKYINTLII